MNVYGPAHAASFLRVEWQACISSWPRLQWQQPPLFVESVSFFCSNGNLFEFALQLQAVVAASLTDEREHLVVSAEQLSKKALPVELRDMLGTNAELQHISASIFYCQ